MKSRKRAPGKNSARGAIRGAQRLRVQLKNGLLRTKKIPTSVPATLLDCRINNARPCFMLRGSAITPVPN